MAGSVEKLHLYREMLKLDPKSRVYALLAEELCDAGEWEEAAEVCRKGLRFHSDHFRSRVLLGWALMELGEVDESGRILMDIYDEIRKNAVIFKLLSEFATFSGDENRAGEFSRIYAVFQGRECIPSGPEALIDSPKSAPETASEEVAVSESVREEKPETEENAEADERLEKILSSLAKRIESKISGAGVAAALFSEKDKDFIWQRILSEVRAVS
jgi:tetratricopeptide (TPR) repeat protein